ncbi:hypothetical protein RB653_006100 [Dictyostelium firmibasis]|uniref:Uncharacterized protein n=1 Tax=Dictyostelium firmibasis TaxID=79012 RepID=A0AAN7UCW1_9MYCE
MDPHTEHEHKAVPLGGKEIPVGMEAHADWMNHPIQTEVPVKEDYGEEYNETEKLREELGNLKKVVTSICQPVQTLYTLQYILDSDDQTSDKKAIEKQILDQQAKRDQIIVELNRLIPLFEKHTEYEILVIISLLLVSYKEGIEEVIKQSYKKFNSKEENFEFGSLCKKITSTIFKDQKVLLDKMKAIKKAKSTQ